jgi:threonine synthase
MKTLFKSVHCLECGHEMEADLFITRCAACGGAWVGARYDCAALSTYWPEVLAERPTTMWRYREMLPFSQEFHPISMGEGWTPLTRATGLERELGHGEIWIKDERQQPTGSFKDRQATFTISALKAQGIDELVLASTGNAAAAYAAYCARAGIKVWIFLPSSVPAEKMRELALYGAEVVKITGTYDQAKKIAADFATRRGIYADKGAKAIPGKESMKTVAFEIAEQLGQALSPSKGQALSPSKGQAPNSKGRALDSSKGRALSLSKGRAPDSSKGRALSLSKGRALSLSKGWRAPDWYVQAVSGGIGPLGVLKGFTELYQAGLIDRVPKLAIVQAEGCAPMVRAWERGLSQAEPVQPDTLVTVLSTGAPGLAYEILKQASDRYGGAMVAVSDGAAFRAMRRVARTEGFSMEPAASVAFAGLEKLLRQAQNGAAADQAIQPGECVVVNCSGHTFSAEKHALEDRYAFHLQTDAPVTVGVSAGGTPASPEGLAAVLEQLDEQITTIVIIEDNPHDSRLIRRLLQSYKHYRIFEAHTGVDGIDLVRQRLPDLVVLDLTLPDMDGFSIIETLKADAHTCEIPVVIVSAKDLTADEQKRLYRHAQSVWQKGSFSARELASHVVEILGDDKPVQRPTVQPAQPRSEPPPIETFGQDRRLHILVVDDHAASARLMRRLFESRQRFQVAEAHSGAEALAAIQDDKPDLIILDLMLPDIAGEQLLKMLREQDRTQDVPVIIVSAKDLDPATRVKLSAQADSIWSKTTFDRSNLLAHVETLLTE